MAAAATAMIDRSSRTTETDCGDHLGILVLAGGLVLIPGAPLVSILFLSQALNAVLLVVLLPFMRSIASDEQIMGEHRLGPTDRIITAITIAAIAASVLALLVLQL